MMNVERRKIIILLSSILFRAGRPTRTKQVAAVRLFLNVAEALAEPITAFIWKLEVNTQTSWLQYIQKWSSKVYLLT
jgi:hypothetical protein